jgi:ribonuclease HII
MMYDYENDLLRRGYHKIAGFDEAGRGPLAGPVVASGVILNPLDPIEGLQDSKQLSAKQRAKLELEIKARALAYSVAVVDESSIDRINIYQAAKLAMLEACATLSIRPEYLLTDAMPLNESGLPYLAIVKGDQKSASIAAASILAKEERDRIMRALHVKYPAYGFDVHKGYPTKAHLAVLKTLGPCPIHRKTFQPVKQSALMQVSLFEGSESS